MGRWSALLAATVVGLLALAPAASAAPAQAPAEQQDPLTAAGVLVDPAAAPPPAIPATSWIVVDLTPDESGAEPGSVLAAQNARTPLAPASTLKLLTALALAPGLADDTTWTGTHDAAAIDGSKVGTVPGSTYTVADLLHGLLLGSGNDCAVALAELSGGGADAIGEMTTTAATLGATDTMVGGPSGLDAPGQVSSARDLALFGRAVLADPRIASVAATQRYAFPGAGTTAGPERPRFEVGNHNRLLGRYPGALGLKNGYTDAARGSFVGVAERDGRRVLVALLQAEGPTWQHAAALLDWAFATPAGLPPVGSIDTPEPVATDSAADGDDSPAASSDARAPAVTTSGSSAAGGGPQPRVVVLLVVAGLGLTVAILRTRVLLRRRTR